MVDTNKIKAKLYSIKYGRKITPEQYEAVKYLAEEHVRDKIQQSPGILKCCNEEVLKENYMNSLFESDNLDNAVKKYNDAKKGVPRIKYARNTNSSTVTSSIYLR